MEARNNNAKNNFITSGAGDLVYEQAQYYSRSYHGLPIRVIDQLARYFYLFAEPQFKFNQKWIAESFDFFSKGLVNTGYKLFGSKDYTGCIAVTSDFRFSTIMHAIDDGAEQVLIIGGASPHAVFHHKNHQNVQFFHVSHGDSFKFQQDALSALQNDVYPNKKVTAAAQGLQDYGKKDDNMHYIDADFTKADLPERLISQGFDPNKKTICSLPTSCYYTPDELTQILASTKTLLNQNSQIITLIVPPDQIEKYLKVSNKYGAVIKTTVTEKAAPEYLFNHGFYMQGQFPTTSIYAAAGLTEAEAKSSTPRQNIYVARPRVEQDVLPELSDVPVMAFDWKNEATSVVKMGM